MKVHVMYVCILNIYTYTYIGLNNLLAAYTDKSAYAQCILAYSPGPGEEVTLFTGRTQVSTTSYCNLVIYCQ